MDHQQGNHSGCPYSKAHCFATGTQNYTRFVPLEIRCCKLSENTKFAQIWHQELGKLRVGKMIKTSQSVGKLPTMAIWRTIFANRVFPILTKSFQKASTFLKRANSSTTKFFRFVKSISELTRIRGGKLGKTILNVKNSPTALLQGAAVFCTEVKIAEGQFR